MWEYYEDIGKIFRNLGNNFGPKEENSEQVAALESKINDIQSEMYGTIEASSREYAHLNSNWPSWRLKLLRVRALNTLTLST